MKDIVELYPLVCFVEWAHTDEMDKERVLFLRQLKKWLKGYDGDWICGVVTVQAVMNTLDYWYIFFYG